MSRLLRQMALAILLCTFVWQAWTSWRKFLQGGTINLAKRLHPKVQPFPDATVCIQYHHQGNASSDANNTHHLETDWLWAYAIPNSYGLHDMYGPHAEYESTQFNVTLTVLRVCTGNSSSTLHPSCHLSRGAGASPRNWCCGSGPRVPTATSSASWNNWDLGSSTGSYSCD